MNKLVLTSLLLLMSGLVAAAGGSGWPLQSAENDVSDKASLQRGAAAYMGYCMGCHSLEYSRYERVADDLGIPHDLYQQHLKFDPDQKIGSLMTNAMDSADGKLWFGAAPPDLTLVARARGTDWLFTYLLTFYKDDSRPYGVNNKVFPDVGMPHVMAELQGLQECAPGAVTAPNGGVLRDDKGNNVLHDASGKALKPCGALEVTKPGALDPAEYRELVRDLVNFLDYEAEPIQLDRQRIGVFVWFYLALFLLFAWLLNREYWKDIH